MIDFKELKSIALANVEDPTLEYFYRYICRWYSKTYHTPLHVVFTLPAQEVVLTYFEEGYEAMDEEARNVEVMRMLDPDFDAKEEESVLSFIEMIEAEEQTKRLIKSQKAESSSQHKPEASNITEPVVRTFQDDTPDDEPNDL